MLETSGPGADPRALLLCLSHLRWDSVTQRPQHLMRHAAGSHRVVFWEEPVEDPSGSDLPRLDARTTVEGITVCTPRLQPGLDAEEAERQQRRLLDRLLASLARPVDVAWFYTPMALAFAAHVEARVTVHDCMDELSAFRGAPPRLHALERDLLRRSDVVFAGGRSLHAARRDRHPAVHLFPSSVDAAHFGRARLGEGEPADQARLPRPRIGFHGVIDERMDLALLEALAACRPGWQFVMVGPLAKIGEADLPRRANIHWLGARPYAELPRYLSGWDAGLMPFAMNEATRFISPTKTPEFLAAGVPLASTPVPDVVHDWGRDGLVEIAADAAGIAQALERAMARPAGPWRERVDRRLQGLSWSATWAGMRERIAQAERVAERAGAAVPAGGCRVA